MKLFLHAGHLISRMQKEEAKEVRLFSGKDENGSSYTFYLSSQQYHACQNACESKENAVIEITYLPHSKYLLQSEVKSSSLFLNDSPHESHHHQPFQATAAPSYATSAVR